MRQIINVLLRLPKWYGLTIILIYSVMIAEFVKVLNTLFMVGGIEKVALMEKIVQLNYGLTNCVEYYRLDINMFIISSYGFVI